MKGPSITPRSPQAHPLVVVRDEPDALPVVARWADVVRVAAPDLAAAHTAREQVRAVVTGAGRDPDAVAVLLDVDPGARAGPSTSVAEAVARRARPTASPCSARPSTPASPPGSPNAACAARSRRAATLRERFGLPRPANHFAGAHR